MSKQQYDVSDCATELNQAIDDTNFPSSRNSSVSSSARESNNIRTEMDKLTLEATVPILNNIVKPTSLKTSLSDDVFDIPGTPKTPRTQTTPGELTFVLTIKIEVFTTLTTYFVFKIISKFSRLLRFVFFFNYGQNMDKHYLLEVV